MCKLFCRTISCFLSAAFVFSAASGASAFEIRSEEPVNEEDAPEYIYYFSRENPYNTFGCQMPNCTAYAWGRTFEATGEKPSLSLNNAGRWYGENIASGAYSYGCEPREGAVLCYDKYDEIHGHVAFTEEVLDGGASVRLSESQFRGDMFRTYEQMADADWSRRGYRLLGYIYTDDTEGKFCGDAFRLVNNETDEYLTRSDDSAVQMSERNETSVSQNFRFEPLENGSYRIWSYASDLVLTRNGDSVFFAENDLSADSEWQIQTEINDLYTICSSEDSSMVLTVSENEAAVSEYAGTSEQFFDLARVTGKTELCTTERNIVFSLDCTQSRTDYYTDEFLDLSGIRFFLGGNEIENVDVSKLTAYYDFTEPGVKTVTVSYGYSSISFDVNVTEPEEGEEIVRNSEFAKSIAKHICETDGDVFAVEFDINGDGVINSADVVLAAE